jgi:hypothetical protein
MPDMLASIRNLVYATGMVMEMARIMPPGAKGTRDRASFIEACVLAFDITPQQVEEEIDG